MPINIKWEMQRCKAHPATAPAGSNRSSYGGNEMAEAFGYGRPVELKQDQALRDAVLLLLDILVESGSSATFRMRDDFVTPA